MDNEDTDDGFYSLWFLINRIDKQVPNHIGLCRNLIEEEDTLYIEADDQIYGFYTNRVRYELEGETLTIVLQDEHVWYWNQEKCITIVHEILATEKVKQCLEVMFNFA